jgi:hypothetical protein
MTPHFASDWASASLRGSFYQRIKTARLHTLISIVRLDARGVVAVMLGDGIGGRSTCGSNGSERPISEQRRESEGDMVAADK